ncbi:zinc finger BED domain-containing protein DAYSLEEPER-like [Miscanthus floridulus]|uniref:zinc finger BED domain-containing protein DAYSLEEPER-like n=1 Tax=Miscanthus floridulus TaxID=154761 RepID=UPI0034583FE5
MVCDPQGNGAMFPVTGDDDLVAAGLSLEHNDDGRDPFAVFDDTTRGTQPAIDIDAVDAGATGIGTVDSNYTGVNGNADGNGTRTPSSGAVSGLGKRKSQCWGDFEEVYEKINGVDVRVRAICKMCRTVLNARSAAGTGHILRHQKSCKQKLDNASRVQSRLAFNADGSLHNWNYDPAVARTELCRLIARLDLPLGFGDTDAFEEYIKSSHNPRFVRSSRRTTTRDLDKLFAERRAMIRNYVHASASVALTSDIWSGNAKEDYISVVAHYVNADWELQKKIVGLRLIQVKHSGENISASIASVVEEYGLVDKIFSITLDNASSNAKAMETLTPMFAGYLGCDPTPDDPTPAHWHVAGKILEFLEVFYDSTVTLSGVYYPTSPLVLHHVLEIATHLHACERDVNLRPFVYPMQHKFLKYWKDIPLLYSFAFILDPRAKLRGMQRVLHLLTEYTGTDYTTYYADLKTELHKMFEKYLRKFGATRSQRVAGPTPPTGKRKQAWGVIFGGSGLPGPSSGTACSSSHSTASELSSYLDSDYITAYEDGFDILLWWKDHKLTYPILAIMARDIMSVPVSTCSSESCFSLAGRIIEERRRSLKPEHVEMLTLLKD